MSVSQLLKQQVSDIAGKRRSLGGNEKPKRPMRNRLVEWEVLDPLESVSAFKRFRGKKPQQGYSPTQGYNRGVNDRHQLCELKSQTSRFLLANFPPLHLQV